MMINMILLFPVIACLILCIFKCKWMNNLMITLYAILHFCVSAYYCTVGVPQQSINKYFGVDSSNIVFLAVLSVVFLAVAIYNNGYMKHEQTEPRRLRHYAYMVLIFVLSMTGVSPE